MGLFSRHRDPITEVRVDWQAVVVDLVRGTCDSTTLGEPPRPIDFFSEHLHRGDTFRDERHGLELGVREGRLDSIAVDIERFPGRLEIGGRKIDIASLVSEPALLALLGDPWWRDEDEDEVILFYEDGRGERQFELSKDGVLKFVTMLRTPLMADPEQRRAYGVTRPWPAEGR